MFFGPFVFVVFRAVSVAHSVYLRSNGFGGFASGDAKFCVSTVKNFEGILPGNYALKY